MKEITEKCDFTKIKNLFSVKGNIKEWQDKPQTGEKKKLQETYLVKNCYLKYTKPLKTQP